MLPSWRRPAIPPIPRQDNAGLHHQLPHRPAVYARGRRTLEKCICAGTTRMRTQVELDPVIGMRGFEGVQALARDYAWAVDMEICVFPQEGLLNNPGTDELLVEGLRRGARVLGAAPYTNRPII